MCRPYLRSRAQKATLFPGSLWRAMLHCRPAANKWLGPGSVASRGCWGNTPPRLLKKCHSHGIRDKTQADHTLLPPCHQRRPGITAIRSCRVHPIAPVTSVPWRAVKPTFRNRRWLRRPHRECARSMDTTPVCYTVFLAHKMRFTPAFPHCDPTFFDDISLIPCWRAKIGGRQKRRRRPTTTGTASAIKPSLAPIVTHLLS